MPPPRSWVSPPTRREFTLLAFSLMIYVLSYNLETSLRMVGVSPSKLSTSYLGKVGLLTTDPGYDRDGRRPPAWRDDLEQVIGGEWEWEEREIAGVERGEVGVVIGPGNGQTPIYNFGKAKVASRSAVREDPGIGITEGITVDKQLTRWESDVPESKTIAHVPGYTILDNIFMLNGTCFLVTDTPSALPPLSFIASSASNPGQPPRELDWRILNKVTAQSVLGPLGGRIRGTTWLSTDSSNAQDPYTLFSLLRANNYLTVPHTRSSVSSSGLHILYPDKDNMGLGGLVGVPPPMRLWFPHVPVFSSPGLQPEGPDEKAHPPMRTKSYIGSHPLLPKAVLPTMGILYTESWKDYADMHVPFVFDRVVVVDRGAAERGRMDWTQPWDTQDTVFDDSELRRRQELEEGLPVWAAPFVNFDVPKDWFEPARVALRSYLGLPAEPASLRKGKPVLTYVSMADEPVTRDARVRDEDHPALLEGLQSLVREGVLGEVHIVRGNGTRDIWEQRMSAIARSSIIIGAFGRNLADSVFMAAPTMEQTLNGEEAPILMELFPTGVFVRDQEYAVRSVGLRYLAWWEAQKFTPSTLPPVMGMREGQNVYLSIDVSAILQEIREEAKRLQS